VLISLRYVGVVLCTFSKVAFYVVASAPKWYFVKLIKYCKYKYFFPTGNYLLVYSFDCIHSYLQFGKIVFSALLGAVVLCGGGFKSISGFGGTCKSYIQLPALLSFKLPSKVCNHVD